MFAGDTQVSIEMIRPDLDALPAPVWPSDHHVRRYQPGDEAYWHDIHVRADRYNDHRPEWFEREFGRDAALLAQRQLYLVGPGGEVIGTSTAWMDADATGRVHWIAVVPEAQGRGLGRALLLATCHRLAELGHRRARLTTQTPRLAAINLYLDVGFLPRPRNDRELAAWRALGAHVRPGLRPGLESALAEGEEGSGR